VAGRPRTGFHALRVAEVTPLTDHAVTLRFAVPSELADAYAHAPGQYLTVRASLDGQRLMRRYSICSPAGSGTLQIGVKRRRAGLFSSHAVDHLRAGDVLDVMTPMGGFTAELEPLAERHHVGVAVGSGITPLRSISMSVLAAEPRSRVTLIYANRTRSGTMFRGELDDLSARHADRFDLVHVIEDGAADGAVGGRLGPDLLASIASSRSLLPDAGPWYLSGPYDLVEALRARLVAARVDAGSVRTESFLRPETAPPEPRRPLVSSA
jgi:ring-1,2-phenylacetyl-CoA epoxidase subunit PaaE